jgi:fructose-specific phosphotransferase system IIC component
MWGVAMAFIQEFGAGQEKPLYIGLGNTLIAPFALLAPFIGGALAEAFGFGATFMVSVIAGLLAALVFRFMVRSPRGPQPLVVFSQQAAAGD